MKIAIVGTGSVALATSALLAQKGHEIVLISLTGEGAKELCDGVITATGSLDMTFSVTCTTDVSLGLRDAAGIIFATSADRYEHAIAAVTPYIENSHQLLISGELAQISSVLQTVLEKDNKSPSITALSTTLATGRRGKDATVKVGIIRKTALASTRPFDREEGAIAFWHDVFGDVFARAPSPLFLTLSNINPIVHIPNALCNFTRMEKGEDWSNYSGITDGVARLITSLDDERVGLAESFGLAVKPFKTLYEENFGFSSKMTLAQMTAELHIRRSGLPKGPVSSQTRYMLEDVPYGLVVFERLGALCGLKVPITSSAITLASTIYDRDFRSENPFLESLTA